MGKTPIFESRNWAGAMTKKYVGGKRTCEASREFWASGLVALKHHRGGLEPGMTARESGTSVWRCGR